MSKNEHELVIIRHRHGHEDSHHGGAWKIAFADFMTAMMALFLVLWLVNSTPKVKSSVAHYFNPVKLVEFTPLKKGMNDINETEAASGADGKKSASAVGAQKGAEPEPASGAEEADATAGKATHTEAALFRDPYAVLSEIAASDAVKSATASKPSNTGALGEAPEAFKDPFSAIPSVISPDAAKGTPARDGVPAKEGQANAASIEQRASTSVEGPSPLGPQQGVPPHGAKVATQVAAKPDQPAPNAQSANAAEAKQIESEIAQAIPKDTNGKPMPNVEVRATDEGILISVTDEQTFAMFAIGSAEPQARTIHAMDILAQQLKKRPGKVVIRGFTDARPYKSPTYDNWRLSSARAHMAQYMLIRGGLDEKRIDAVEGFADRRPKIANDPMAPENRRIEVLLQAEKSK